MKININEAKKTIKQLNLSPIMNIWHYSFNFEYFYDSMNFDGTSVYADRHINHWSPRPIFTNKKIDRVGRVEGRNPYWMCELTTFDEYLKRRDSISKRKKSHFPTTKSFHNKHSHLNGELITMDFNKAYFIKIYDKLLRDGHMVGSDLVDSFYNNNKGIPEKWIKMIELHANGIKAVALIIDDGKSNSLFNLASILDENSWGLYMLSLWIKDCCERGIKFVDCGISGTYGYYKDAFFLDAVGNI